MLDFESNDTSISYMLAQRVVDHLTHRMQDVVVDETQLGLVRSGKLQDDPTLKKLNVLIREGGDEFPDIILPSNYMIKGVTYELGGGVQWLRRFIAKYELFFFGQVSRDEARRRANVIFSRFKAWIPRTSLEGMTDSFDETAILCQVVRQDAFEAGGPGSFIWRATHYFEFLTDQMFDED